MPSVSSLDALERAVAGFEVRDLGLVIDPPARAAARRSLDESGLLLLGEVHGVRENPLVIRALMQAFGLNALALEWPDRLAPVIAGYLTGGVLADHPALWLGDGRITAGHLAMLSERAAAGGDLDLTLFDRVADAGWTWSQRDEAMAEVILARTAGAGTLAVAGNAHTRTRPTDLGVPLGARLARQRPGVLDVRISYSGGRFYNLGPREFQGHRGGGTGPRRSARPGQIRLHLLRGRLILDLPQASEATVPHRPVPGWSGALPAEAGDAD